MRFSGTAVCRADRERNLNQPGGAEPLGTYAHPWPEAKSWPARATFRQAEEILRLSEGYRLYAAPEDTFFSPLRPAA